MDGSNPKDLAGAAAGFGWADSDAHALVAALMELLPTLRHVFHRALGGRQVTAWEALILLGVHRRGRLRLWEVSRRVGMAPSTLTGVVGRLERQGLVRRVRDQADRRGVLLEGAPALAGWVAQVEVDLERDLGLRLESLPGDLVPRLARDLEMLGAALREPEAGGPARPPSRPPG